jgi:hypothetical protein
MKYLILIFLTSIFTINELKSEEKQVWTLVIHYLSGVAHTSVPQGCYNQFLTPTAGDTIIYDRDILDRIENFMTEIKPYEFNPNEYYDCDIRLTAVILYRDYTFDIVCVAGEFYERACMQLNQNRVTTHPELVKLLFETIYDKEEPLTRRILFGIRD